ncbi:MAG: Kiwa anti-phage protein KwaB-like domain-containing protein [Nitrosomonas sp.]
MPNNNNANLFALVDDEESPVRRIPLTAELSAELSQLFAEQKNALLDGKQAFDFTGSYNVDHGEIFTIAAYPLPQAIGQAISNPLTNSRVLNLKNETHRIKALFSGTWTVASKVVNFQVFDTGKLLKCGFTLIGSGDTYKKLEEPGLILQDKLTAHYDNGTLYFSSYHNTKRFLDLADYYREATDTDLDAFAETKLFAFKDKASFKDNADSIIRKKIALLQKNKVLENITVADMQTVANNFNQELPEEHRIHITVNDDGKLVIPEDKKQLKELIRFLDEDYVTTPLTKRKCLTNSKQYL